MKERAVTIVSMAIIETAKQFTTGFREPALYNPIG